MNRDGSRTTITYDAINRTMTKTLPNNAVASFSYDAASRQICSTTKIPITTAFQNFGLRMTMREIRFLSDNKFARSFRFELPGFMTVVSNSFRSIAPESAVTRRHLHMTITAIGW